MEVLALTGIPNIQPGDDLVGIILAAIDQNGLQIKADDVIVVAQKIVSKSENRLVQLAGIEPSSRACELGGTAEKDPRLVELILSESQQVVRCCPGVLIVEDIRGLVLANAGIDASNVEPSGSIEAVLLLPRDPDSSADHLRQGLAEAGGCEIGVVINDSIGRAWRNGTVGTAIGISGLPGLLNLRGVLDLYGRPLRTTEIGFADELAATASVMMGQAGEGHPVILIRGAPYARREGNARELRRLRSTDLFR